MSTTAENRDLVGSPAGAGPALVAYARANANIEIVPAGRWRQRRHDLESITPHVTKLQDNEQLAADFEAWLWQGDRILALKFLSQFGKVDGLAPDEWQKDYFKGKTVTGAPAPEHRTKRALRPVTPLPRTDA